MWTFTAQANIGIRDSLSTSSETACLLSLLSVQNSITGLKIDTMCLLLLSLLWKTIYSHFLATVSDFS